MNTYLDNPIENTPDGVVIISNMKLGRITEEFKEELRKWIAASSGNSPMNAFIDGHECHYIPVFKTDVIAITGIDLVRRFNEP